MIGSTKTTEAKNGDGTTTYRTTITSSYCPKDNNSYVVLNSVFSILSQNPNLYLMYGKGFFDNMKLHHDGEKWVAVFTTTL